MFEVILWVRLSLEDQITSTKQKIDKSMDIVHLWKETKLPIPPTMGMKLSLKLIKNEKTGQMYYPVFEVASIEWKESTGKVIVLLETDNLSDAAPLGQFDLNEWKKGFP